MDSTVRWIVTVPVVDDLDMVVYSCASTPDLAAADAINRVLEEGTRVGGGHLLVKTPKGMPKLRRIIAASQATGIYPEFHPIRCRRCSSANTRITHSNKDKPKPDHRRRHMRCLDCGRKWTMEEAPDSYGRRMV